MRFPAAASAKFAGGRRNGSEERETPDLRRQVRESRQLGLADLRIGGSLLIAKLGQYPANRGVAGDNFCAVSRIFAETRQRTCNRYCFNEILNQIGRHHRFHPPVPATPTRPLDKKVVNLYRRIFFGARNI